MTCIACPPTLDPPHFLPSNLLTFFTAYFSHSHRNRNSPSYFPKPLQSIAASMMHLFFLTLLVNFLGCTSASLTYLNLTAISAANGASILECWQLSAPFVVSSQPGTAGAATAQLGNVANASFSVIPAQFNGGVHRAPAVQYVPFSDPISRSPRVTSNTDHNNYVDTFPSHRGSPISPSPTPPKKLTSKEVRTA